MAIETGGMDDWASRLFVFVRLYVVGTGRLNAAAGVKETSGVP